MPTASDPWLVRLPDGRVLRAESTQALRYHVRTGRLPVGCHVRRTAKDDWAAMAWTAEFADLVGPQESNGQPRAAAEAPSAPAGSGYRPLSVRGLAEELVQAFDSSLKRWKLRWAFLVGVVGGLGLTVIAWLPLFMGDGVWPEEFSAIHVAGGVIGGILIGLTCLAAVVVTQMTFIELSRLRAARTAEVRENLVMRTLHLILAIGAVGGAAVGLIVLVSNLPKWVPDDFEKATAAVCLALHIALQCLLWPLAGMALLLAPIIVIQDVSVWQAFKEWVALIRQHLARVFFSETLALAMGLIMALPLLFPILWANYTLDPWGQPATPATALQSLAGQATLALLGGVALSPTIGYLFVANVLIYLNLKYEFTATDVSARAKR